MIRDDFANRYPKGWFGVLFSSELAAGEIKSLRYFDREFVAFRGENGQVAVLDAYCPHLGAHLGGGSCSGNSIRCPYHGWEFSQSGRCLSIPYSKVIPPKAKEGALKAYRVCEINEMIHLWFDPADGEPTWGIPVVPEMNGAAGWTRWYFKRWRVKTQGKEIIENLVDAPHFAVVHRSPVDEITVEFNGHIASQTSLISGHPTLGKRLKTVATYFGPALQHVDMEGTYESKQVNFHTPVGFDGVDLCYGLKLRRDPSLPDTDAVASEYASFAHNAFAEDIAIWERKIYRTEPLLCPGDGRIFDLRRWYGQFFDECAPETPGQPKSGAPTMVRAAGSASSPP